VIIVGGAYHENSYRPAINRLRGSGLRAAIVLRSEDPPAHLKTAVSAEERDEFEAVVSAFRLSAEAANRDLPVNFSYFTPISPPAIDGLSAEITEPITADDEVVLYFGLIESPATVEINCRTLIVDPQGDRGSLSIRDATYERLAVVANEREIRRIGQDDDEVRAAEAALRMSGAEVVIVKCGARGVLVVDEHTVERIGPRPTTLVQPIGSGDVFSATFAHAFATGTKANDAARLASIAAAAHVSCRAEGVTPSGPYPSESGFTERPTVYLAGPFFGLSQLWLVDLAHRALSELGANPFSPYHDVGLGGVEVARRDLDGLDDSDSVLALIDEFDSGTVFEIGYAIRSETPVVAYMDPRRTENLTMLEGTGVEVVEDLASAVYRSIWRGMGT
jgi:hypothetical protein